MTDQIKEKLNQAAIDAETAIERFMGNEGLYLKYLCRFSEDDNYQKLCTALQTGDCQNAFIAAHTLKGVCGNLSITKIETILKEMVDDLRSGNVKKAEALLDTLEETYSQIKTMLEDISKNFDCTEK